MKIAPPTERTIQRALIVWLRLVLPQGSMVAAIVNEQGGASANPWSRARFGLARKASGVVSGWPDLVVTMPAGRVIFIELKGPGGIVSEAQAGIHMRLNTTGHTVLVVDSVESCRGALQAIDVALREAAGQAVAVPRVRIAKAARKLPTDMVPF